MALNDGQVLNQRYQIVRLLGQGGFGAVYQAWDLNLKVPCAVKENFETSPSAMRQFEREASMLATLRHPNLPRVTDHFIIPGQGQYLVMDYIEGEDLQTILERDRKELPESQVVSWLVEICDALSYLHTQPIPVIHRDIKPANIKITPSGRPMLVDFGIAKAFNPESRTTLGARAFTPGYSPFEQYGQAPTDARSDLYALGATAYGVLTGQAPTESIARMAGTPLPQPRQLNPAISPQTEEAILKALEIMPDKRFQNALEFKQALSEKPGAEHTFMVSPVYDNAKMQPAAATQLAPAAATQVNLPPEIRAVSAGRPKSNPAAQATSSLKLIGIGIGIGGVLLVGLAALAGLVYLLGVFPSTTRTTPTYTASQLLTRTMTSASPTRTLAKPVQTEAPAITEAPAATQAPAAKFKACQVTDTGGIDDKSFNATAWKGVEDAMKQFGIEGKYLESQQQTDYEKNINAFLDEKCDIIITVGFLLGDATKAAAEKNPNVKFSIVDFAYDPAIPNVLGQVFSTDQAGFLAGYVAAGVTRTGKVGTFGGIQIPTVTVFMDGYAMGVKAYNDKHGTKVEVLGWDPATQTGLFTGNFESTDDGRTMGQTLMDEGADIIMPVAGPVGLGTAAAAKERGGVYIVGVDADWYLTNPDYKDITLTSVMKNMDVTTVAAIKSVMDGTFKGGVTVGDLKNGGVGLAPFHDLEALVSASLKAELEELSTQIISGALKTQP